MAAVQCLVVNDGSKLLVEIPTDSSVRALKEWIMTKKQFTWPPMDPLLFLAKKADGLWLTENDRVTFMAKGEVPDFIRAFEMSPQRSIGDSAFGFPDKDARVDGDIHVLVELPSDTNVRSRSIDNGATVGWLTKFRATQVPPDALPSIHQLSSIIESDLPVKIGIHPALLAKWDARIMPANPQLLAKLFKAQDWNPCIDLCDMMLFRIVHPATTGTTKGSFISFWDDSIRCVLNFMFPTTGQSDRDRIDRVSVRPSRPDYHFRLNSVCVFRGEEETPAFTMELQRRALCKNLVWTHGDLPYLFGYAAVGKQVNLYALEWEDDEVESIELASFYLDSLDERFRMLLALLHLSRLFKSIVDICPASGEDEFRNMTISNGDLIRLSSTHVEKDFVDKARFKAVSRQLEHVYAVLREHQVPNVDDLEHICKSNLSIRLQPRGNQVKPSNLSDLFRAVECVLEALVALHRASWMHRDIRWSNVLKRRDNSNSWFLIDFVDSASSPQPCLHNGALSEQEHAPEIFLENVEHTTVVDIWAVGFLIETSGAYDSWYDWGARTQFVELLLEEDPSRRPNAEEALQKLKLLEKEYKQQEGHQGLRLQGPASKRKRTTFT